MDPDGIFPHHIANPLVDGNTGDLCRAVVQRQARGRAIQYLPASYRVIAIFMMPVSLIVESLL
jgi:hypothetical protein